MKKVLLLFVFLISGITSAQSLRFGAKIGMNASSLSNIQNAQMRMGFHIGGVAEFEINEKFYVQPEMFYSTAGTDLETYDLLDENIKIDTGIKLDYITIPIMAKYYIKGGLSAIIGPYASFIVNSKQGRGENKIDLSETVNGVDYGVGFGLNYILPNALNFDIRYNMGMNNVWKEDIIKNNINNKESNNGVFQISVGYFFK